MKRSILLVCALALSFGASAATTRYWLKGDGDWSDTSRWKGGKKPGSGEAAQFAASVGAATVTMDEDSAGLAYMTLEGQEASSDLAPITLIGSQMLAQGSGYTSDFTIGNNRKLVIDGATFQLNRSMKLMTNAVIEVKSGVYRTVDSGYGIIFRPNSRLEVTGGLVDLSRLNTSDCAATGAVIRLDGGCMKVGASVFSKFSPEFSCFDFRSGTLVGGIRLKSSLPYAFPPKGAVFDSTYDTACEMQLETAGDIVEICGSAFFTNRTDAYSTMSGTGATLRGGGTVSVYNFNASVYNVSAWVDLARLNLGTQLYSGSYNGYVNFLGGVTLGCWNDVAVGGPKYADFVFDGALAIDTRDCFNKTDTHDFQLQKWCDFSKMTDFSATGGGTVLINAETGAGYLRSFSLAADTTLSLTSVVDRIETTDLTLGARSILKVGANKVSASGTVSIDPTAKIAYSFDPDAFTAGERYQLWEGGFDNPVPMASFTFDPAIPEGWFVTNVHGVAWISDGTVVPPQTDVDPTHQGHWCGALDGNWHTVANWTDGIPSGISHYAYFSGDNQLAVTNDKAFREMRNIQFFASSGPYVIRGLDIPVSYGNRGTCSVSSTSPFPQRFEAKVVEDTERAFDSLALYSTGGSYLEFASDGEWSSRIVFFRGDIRIGGMWNVGRFAPQDPGAGSRPTRLTVLPGASVSVVAQDWTGLDTTVTSNQAYKGIYDVRAGGTMSVAGSLWRWSKYANRHFIDGTLTATAPIQMAEVQTFRGAGVFTAASVRSDTAASSSMSLEGSLTFRLGAWTTVREGADNPMTLVVRDTVTLGATTDWAYGPAAGFASATDATNRAIRVEGGAKTTLSFDTQDPTDAAVGHTITLADPILQSNGSTLVKKGKGTLVLASSANELKDVELRGGKLAVAAPIEVNTLTFAGGALGFETSPTAGTGYQLIATARKIVGTPSVDSSLKLRLVESQDRGTTRIEAKPIPGMILILR